MDKTTLLQETLNFRAYCDEDWLAVCSIHDRARPYELKGSCSPQAFVPLAEDAEDLNNFHHSEKFVAYIGNKIVGFVGVDGTLLSWLYVSPDYFGYGIGRELLALALELTGPRARTIVLAGNARARHLYEKAGFESIHTFESTNAGYPCNCLELALRQESVSQQSQSHAA
ncbi:MAG: GNAT family N-acetyltransferase [Cyanobacteria bacterium P01_D01_bin.156]